ncbi:MAG: ABC transporter ATP-binding protein, partial [Actinomycetota bacterium]|nr:ABC transporter ATP-binding protein [Actinomycetota bacterium]
LYRFYRAGDEETLALRGVSLRVDTAQILAVTGPSGSGKSTLLNCLAGLDEPDGGMVRLLGMPLSHQPEADRARLRARHLGVLLQTRNLVPHLNLADNITLAQGAARSPGWRARRHDHPPVPARDLLGSVGLAHRASEIPAHLSGGELARASLAVALANQPAVLLADEPTGELDGDTERQVLQLLRDRAAAGTAIVVVTHSDRVTGIADRVVELHDGQLAA